MRSRTTLPRVVFPHPDSPTTPIVSPVNRSWRRSEWWIYCDLDQRIISRCRCICSYRIDVFESFARSMLFGNNSATAAWILDQGLLPGVSIYGPFDTSYYWIHHAITYSNTSQSVTFHLLPSTPVYAYASEVGGNGTNVSTVYSNHLGEFMNETENTTTGKIGLTSVKVYNYGVSGIFYQFLAGPTVSEVMDNSWLAAHGGSPGDSNASFAVFSKVV